MSVETSVVSHVVRNGDEALVYLIEQAVTVEYFGAARTSEAFAWLLAQFNEYGHVPTEERFERRFPNFKLVVEPDPLPALVDELRAHHARNVARDKLPPIVREFERSDRDFDLDMVLGGIAELQAEISVVTDVNEVALLSKEMSTFLDRLLAMDGEEVPGIPTGFDALDMASGGWQAENFGVIGAGPKRFKTAILVWMALAAAEAGYACDFITFEMSIHELMQRIYCLGSHVNYTHILRGTLSDREKRLLKTYKDKVADWEGEIRLVHEITAVTSLTGLASKLRTATRKPDIVFIDGLYQMRDDSRSRDSEAMELTAVSRGLKRLAATEGIPIIGTTQALLSRISVRKGTEMGSLGYTSAFAQDANVIIGIDRPDMMSNDIVVKVIGARAMAGSAINVTVDLDNGTIYEGDELGGDGGVGIEY